jgi:quinol monooxygenase YgiN
MRGPSGRRASERETEHRVHRDLHDPNRVVVHNDFPSEEAARAFVDDPSLKDVMERAGVEGEPGISFMEYLERKLYADAVVA